MPNAPITTIGTVDIYAGVTYRVDFTGASTPRYSGAIWKFNRKGRGGTAHGEIISHPSSSIVNKYKGEDLYLSDAKFVGNITEVRVTACVGATDDGSVPCELGEGRGPAQIIEDVTSVASTVPVRCYSCKISHESLEAERAVQDRRSSIEERVAAAAARRNGEEIVAGPVITAPRTSDRRIEIIPVSSDHPLFHLVPHISKYNDYVSRDLEGGVKDLDFLTYKAQKNNNVLLSGPTESGKTGFLEAWCALHGQPLVTVPCNGGIDPNSLFARKEIKDGSTETLLSSITKAFIYGGVVYWDELNFAPGKVTAVAHSALDDRRQVTIADLGYKTYDLHPQCFIVAAINPGYADTRPLNEATRRRFTQVDWGYDENVEQQLIVRLPALHKIKVEVRRQILAQEIETPLGPAKLIHFEEHAIDLNLDLAVRLFLDSFGEDERDSIREIIVHHRHELEEQLQAIKDAS